MPHIHTEPGQYDQTASAFVFRRGADEPRLLLHMHKKLGKYMQPGGHVELHETPWQTVIHELAEETGYLPEQLTVLQPAWRIATLISASVHPVPFVINSHQFSDHDHYHTDMSFLFEVSQEPHGALGQGESADFLWVTSSELAAMATGKKGVGANVRQIGLAAFAMLDSWQRISLSAYER